MKILLISDIHANIDALHALDDAEKNYDAILCAGDFVDWGFFPHETIAWFSERASILTAVQGNHDRHLLQLYRENVREPFGAETTYASWCRNRMTEDDFAFLDALPAETTVSLDGCSYYMTHFCGEEAQLDRAAEIMSAYKSQTLFDRVWSEKAAELPGKRRIVYGHSHECWMHLVRRDALFLNPGSLSYRKGEDRSEPGGDYIVLIDGEPVMRHIDYPTANVRRLIASSAFSDKVKRTGRDQSGSRIDPDEA